MAKKRTRPARRPGAAEAHERRQARLDARREARARELAAQEKAARRARIVRFAIIGLLVGGFLSFFLLRAPRDVPESINGHRVQQFPETGIGQHVTGTVDYDSTPPTHGPHGVAAECGVHAEPIANEHQVHMLEHGVIGVQYRPDLDLADVRAIEDIVRSYDGRVFSAPYPGMSSPIAVTSWGELMRLDSLDADAIKQYIADLRGDGPEDVSCDSTADEPFKPGATEQGANGRG